MAVGWDLRRRETGILDSGEELSAARESLGPNAVGEEPIVADVHEAGGQDVEKKPADEFDSVEGHGSLAVSVGIVLDAEGHLTLLDRYEPLIGDSDPVSVAGEVFEGLLGTSEGGFCIDDPVGLLKGLEEVLPLTRVWEPLQFSGECEIALLVGLPEQRKKLPSKQPAEDPYGKEETRPAGNPTGLVRRESPARNNALDVRVVMEVLSPCVEYADEADLGSQMFG
jgi:hypothetical protein